MMKDRTKAVIALCFSHWLWHTGTQWTNSLLPFLQWDSQPPMTMLHASYFHSFGSLCNALGALFLGSIIESFGTKKAFIVSAVFTGIYYLGLSWCQSLALFFLVQTCRLGYHFDGLSEMYLASVTSEKERTNAVMALGLPLSLAMVSGPLFATRIAVAFGLRTSQLCNGLFILLVLIPVILRFLPEPQTQSKRSSVRLNPEEYWPLLCQNRGLREGLLLRFLLVVPHIGYELISRQFLMRVYVREPGDASTILMSMGASVLVTQLILLPQLQRLLSPKALLQTSFGILLLCYALLPSVRGYHQLVAVTALQAAAYALCYAETSTQISVSVGKMDLGKATGLAAMAQWSAHFLAPIFTGHLVTTIHYSYAFYISASITVATLLLVSFVFTTTNARIRSVLPVLSLGG